MIKIGLIAGVAFAAYATGAWGQAASASASAGSFTGTASDLSEGLFTRDQNVSVKDRPHPEYDALGVREGGFLIFPKLQTSLDYDDNIYAEQTDKASDGIFEATGSVQAKSQWSRNSLNALATVTRDQFFSHSTENTTQYTFETDGRYDILRNVYITGQGEYDNLTEPRSAESANTASISPISYDRGLVDVKGVYGINRFRLSEDINFQDFDYDNGRTVAGLSVDQTYRNHTELRARTEGDYAISPTTAVYATVTALNFDYSDNADKVVFNRDSNGYEAAVGVDFELSALIRAKGEIGYRTESFAQNGVSDVSGVAYHAQLEYFPTQLTTATFTANRTIEDSGIEFAPAFVANAYSAEVDHELLRNLLLTAKGEYGHFTLVGIDRQDDRGGITIGASYLLNHGIGLNVSYGYFKQTSSGAERAQDFDINQIKIGLVAQY